jgi:leader peptidase (prepilin peptidase)/N-methyltransferase
MNINSNVDVVLGLALVGAAMGRLGRRVLGRCGIPCHPPWCEIASAGLSALIGWRAAGSLPSWWLPVPLVLGWFAVPLVAADLARRRLPDRLTLAAYPAIGLCIGTAAVGGGPALGLRAVVGVLLFGGAHALVRLLRPTAMGGGDVKLAGSLGAVLAAVGWPALAVAAALAACVTAVLAVARRARAAPHGPGLLAATWLIAAFPGGHLPAAT